MGPKSETVGRSGTMIDGVGEGDDLIFGSKGVSKTAVNATTLFLALRTDRRYQTLSSLYATLYCNIPAGRIFSHTLQ
jgi:hypothetical protein